MGIVDGKIKAVGDDMTQLVSEALASVGLDDYELVTLYYGADVTEEEATELMEKLAEKFPEIEFEVHLGRSSGLLLFAFCRVIAEKLKEII